MVDLKKYRVYQVCMMSNLGVPEEIGVARLKEQMRHQMAETIINNSSVTTSSEGFGFVEVKLSGMFFSMEEFSQLMRDMEMDMRNQISLGRMGANG